MSVFKTGDLDVDDIIYHSRYGLVKWNFNGEHEYLDGR